MNKITCVSFMVYPGMEDRHTSVFFHRENVNCAGFHGVTHASWMRLQSVLGGEYMSECYMFSSGGFDIRYNFPENE